MRKRGIKSVLREAETFEATQHAAKAPAATATTGAAAAPDPPTAVGATFAGLLSCAGLPTATALVPPVAGGGGPPPPLDRSVLPAAAALAQLCALAARLSPLVVRPWVSRCAGLRRSLLSPT